MGTVFRLDLDGATYTVLRSFLARGGDGYDPEAALAEATSGCLYGTTRQGGRYDLGTVFKMNKDGTSYTLLHAFAGTNGPGLVSDGALPVGGLLQGTDGALYGTASWDYEYELIGQGTTVFAVGGNGTVFRLQPDGSDYQVIKHFNGGADGGCPYGGLIQATNGMLYGTTFGVGGAWLGTVFRMNLDGSGYAVLKNFSGPDGYAPQAALLQGRDGLLYGTTQSGGAGGGGTVFTLNLDGSGFAVLKRFLGSDGSSPQASLTQGLDGALYGTTLTGGKYSNGTVFKLNPDGTGFAVLRHFMGRNGNGSAPRAPLLQTKDGLLYGTTSGGGNDTPVGVGTVFRMNPDGGGFVILHDFVQDFHDGLSPGAGLIQASDGIFYGTTTAGARDQNGTIFRLVPQAVMSPPVQAAGNCRLRFSGLASRAYTIQRASAISGPWAAIGTVTSGVSGTGEFLDANPPPGAAFYRAASQ